MRPDGVYDEDWEEEEEEDPIIPATLQDFKNFFVERYKIMRGSVQKMQWNIFMII